MLSGISINSLPTTNSLDAAQQVQPSATQPANNNGQINQNTNHSSNDNSQSKDTGNTQAVATNDSKTDDVQKISSDNCEFKQAIDQAAQNSDQEAPVTDEEDEDLTAAVAAVLTTISANLAKVADDIEIDLDLTDLSIDELADYKSAVTLIDKEIQLMMSDTIEEISSVDMTELGALTEKSELLDDLQSLHEELIEAADEIDFERATLIAADEASTINLELESDDNSGAIEIEGFDEINPQTLNADIKPEQEKKEAPEEKQEIQLQTEIKLEPIKRDAPQEQAPTQETQSLEKAEAVKTNPNEAKELEAVEAKSDFKLKETKSPESFLDKIKFISHKEVDPRSKEQIRDKANVDSKIKQVIIQAADEIKSMITNRVKSNLDELNKDELKIDIQIETVDVTDNNPASFLGKLVSESFKQLNLSGPRQELAFSPKQAMQIVHEKVMAAPVNTQEVLRFQLNPKNLGAVTITISRELNHVSIKMVADTDAAVGSLKNDMSTLQSSLKEKGLELKDIDISKASSEGAYNQQQRGDFNEAREEQKKRMTENQPHWLAEDVERSSFESQLKGILNIWQSKG